MGRFASATLDLPTFGELWTAIMFLLNGLFKILGPPQIRSYARIPHHDSATALTTSSLPSRRRQAHEHSSPEDSMLGDRSMQTVPYESSDDESNTHSDTPHSNTSIFSDPGLPESGSNSQANIESETSQQHQDSTTIAFTVPVVANWFDESFAKSPCEELVGSGVEDTSTASGATNVVEQQKDILIPEHSLRLTMSDSELALNWLNCLSTSWLHHYVSVGLEHRRRPKIAIINTGSDSRALFVDGLLERRLRNSKKQYNYKDFWDSASIPRDETGHGTAVLSVIHRIVPFADICVARFVSSLEDMKIHPKRTSRNLAQVISSQLNNLPCC